MIFHLASPFTISFLNDTTLLFVVLILVLFIYILIYLLIKNRTESKYKRWKYIIDSLIPQVIFFEPKDYNLIKKPEVPITKRLKKLLNNKYFRALLIKELISAKENMSGVAGENLKRLYLQLNLNTYALDLLRSKSWHKIANAIQELGVMEMHQYRDKIEPYINHKKLLVRLEAQTTLLKFNGFKGLFFLNQANYPLTEWQQIKLLEQLNTLPPGDLSGIENWLKSKNDSVVIFALKLTRNYFQFQLHEQIVDCLKHPHPEVRYEAILTLKAIPTELTAKHLIAIYDKETQKNKIQIINALKEVGSHEEFDFLIDIIQNEEVTIQFKAAQTLAALKPNGFEKLCQLPEAQNAPLRDMINHIKSV